MKKILVIILSFLIFSINAAWEQCNSDSDCKDSNTVCYYNLCSTDCFNMGSQKVCVPTNYKEAYEAFVQEVTASDNQAMEEQQTKDLFNSYNAATCPKGSAMPGSFPAANCMGE